MKKIKQILFLCVFIAGMAFTPKGTVEASMAPKANPFYVLVNLTTIKAPYSASTYNENVPIIVRPKNLDNGELDTGWGTPGAAIETNINLSGEIEVKVTVVASDAPDRIQYFTFNSPPPFVTINMTIHEDEVPANPGD